jgi:hypothetical protein
LEGSHGWLFPNGVNIVAYEGNNGPVTVNGVPLTEDFDLAVYIKGDKKTTAIYNAQMIIEYEGTVVTPPPSGDVYDVELTLFRAPRRAEADDDRRLVAKVLNHGPNLAEGTLSVVGIDAVGGNAGSFNVDFGPLAPGDDVRIRMAWDIPDYTTNMVVDWTATVNAAADSDLTNNTLDHVGATG